MPLPALTDAEKKILKEFGGEMKFLQSYGLSIFDDDEREEGRAILKGLVKVDRTTKK